MHRNRVLLLAGTVLGAAALFMKSLSSEGEAALAQLHASDPSFPNGIPTIWGGLDTWAQVLVVIVVVVLALIAIRPDVVHAIPPTEAVVATVMSLALAVYAVVKFLDAGDKADALEAAFAQAAAGDVVPAAWAVSIAIGFYLLLLATLAALVGSGLNLSSRTAAGPPR